MQKHRFNKTSVTYTLSMFHSVMNKRSEITKTIFVNKTTEYSDYIIRSLGEKHPCNCAMDSDMGDCFRNS